MRSVLILVLGCTLGFGASVPRPADELAWVASDGRPLRVGTHKGKVVVLEFLSTTCEHCQFTSKVLSKLQAEFGTQGVQMLGMAINEDADVGQFVRNFNVTFPVGKNKREEALRFMQHSVMNSFYYPGLLFVDRNGVVQAQYTGSDLFLSQATQEANIRNQIIKLLGTAGAAAKPATPKPARKVS